MSYEEFRFEELLAFHCAPVLKKKKVANMFHVEKAQFCGISTMVDMYNHKLNMKGLFLKIFQQNKQRITVYLYQKDALSHLLHNTKIQTFLKDYQYPCDHLESYLAFLDKRLETCGGYPHEIGIFLGYPLCDVIGFINHLPCLYCGYWRVYQDAKHACELFTTFDRCSQELQDGISCGKCIEQLIA